MEQIYFAIENWSQDDRASEVTVTVGRGNVAK